MLSIQELNLGFNDAENYRHKDKKELFSRIFIRTTQLNKLCENYIYFLIGDKGVGKTAHAVYMSNQPYTPPHTSNIAFHSKLVYIRETEYDKFIEMKKRHHLHLSDYTSIWIVILYLLIAKQISLEEKLQNAPISNWMKFRNLENAIDEYYDDAFSPEIITAMDFVEQADISLGLINRFSLTNKSNKKYSKDRFQTNITSLRRKFEEALKELKLVKNHILFIDGIDIRPSSIDYKDYLDCIKGLANAVWRINNDFFPQIKDSKGRIKVVLLMRPDIFDSIGLQNQNNKIRDNSIVLNLLTDYENYRKSELFAIVDRLLAVQQDNQQELKLGEAWDHYFPFKIGKRSYKARQGLLPDVDDSPFIEFIRLSFHRPRDIISALSFLKDSVSNQDVFQLDNIENSNFRREYSEYLLGEIKDQLSFYYTSDDYKVFRKFFTYLNGDIEFKYDEYKLAYDQLIDELGSIKIPVFLDNPDSFLQFLYELNVLCYIQYTESGEPHIHWCFRDRTPTNLTPRIKLNVSYRIHYGIAKALNVGKKFRR